MIDLELGPVVAQTGGGVEIITEDFDLGRSESRTWQLPTGWGAGVIAMTGEASHGSSVGTSRPILFGAESVPFTGTSAAALHGVGELPGTVFTDGLAKWSGTVTLIRID